MSKESQKGTIIVEDPYADDFDGDILPGAANFRNNSLGRVSVAFSEMLTEPPPERGRMSVVLDCANVGWSYGGNMFAAEGIRIALHYLVDMGACVAAFLPAHYLFKKPRDGTRENAVMATDDFCILEEMVNLRQISVVPSGDNDDHYILSYARENGAYVISNDHFGDHIRTLDEQGLRRSLEAWVNSYRCSYTFANNKFILNPASSLTRILAECQEKRMVVTNDISRQRQHKMRWCRPRQPARPQQHPSHNTSLHSDEAVAAPSGQRPMSYPPGVGGPIAAYPSKETREGSQSVNLLPSGLSPSEHTALPTAQREEPLAPQRLLEVSYEQHAFLPPMGSAVSPTIPLHPMQGGEEWTTQHSSHIGGAPFVEAVSSVAVATQGASDGSGGGGSGGGERIPTAGRGGGGGSTNTPGGKSREYPVITHSEVGSDEAQASLQVTISLFETLNRWEELKYLYLARSQLNRRMGRLDLVTADINQSLEMDFYCGSHQS